MEWNIKLRGVPAGLIPQAKAAAAMRQITLNDLVIEAIRKAVAADSKKMAGKK